MNSNSNLHELFCWECHPPKFLEHVIGDSLFEIITFQFFDGFPPPWISQTKMLTCALLFFNLWNCLILSTQVVEFFRNFVIFDLSEMSMQCNLMWRSGGEAWEWRLKRRRDVARKERERESKDMITNDTNNKFISVGVILVIIVPENPGNDLIMILTRQINEGR